MEYLCLAHHAKNDLEDKDQLVQMNLFCLETYPLNSAIFTVAYASAKRLKAKFKKYLKKHESHRGD